MSQIMINLYGLIPMSRYELSLLLLGQFVKKL